MIKGAAIAAGVLLIVVQVDEHYYSGFYTDGVLAMFHQIRDSFGWYKTAGASFSRRPLHAQIAVDMDLNSLGLSSSVLVVERR